MPAWQAANYLLSGCRVDPPVKNTFIHFNFGTSENDAAPEAEVESSVFRANYHRSHSDPVHGEGSMSDLSMSVERSTSTQNSLHSLLPSSRAQGSSHVTSEGSSHYTSEARSSARSTFSSASGNSFFSDAEAAKSEDRDGSTRAPPTQGSVATRADARELPGRVPSIGALGHNTGTCKPCAWNWKPGGCVNGTSCEFCHMCDRVELKLRRKQRVAVLRKAEREHKQRMARVGAVDDERVGETDSRGLDSSSLCAIQSNGHANASNTARGACHLSTTSAAMVNAPLQPRKKNLISL
mmetsp:Transcript_33918/g.65632  ORF Transcript_33918/g.65632 Transcript_33918/m.65632 type:complete len:295 (-) Transcript_33918:134-1018(-)